LLLALLMPLIKPEKRIKSSPITRPWASDVEKGYFTPPSQSPTN
jgi:hypothetical protein